MLRHDPVCRLVAPPSERKRRQISPNTQCMMLLQFINPGPQCSCLRTEAAALAPSQVNGVINLLMRHRDVGLDGATDEELLEIPDYFRGCDMPTAKHLAEAFRCINCEATADVKFYDSTLARIEVARRRRERRCALLCRARLQATRRALYRFRACAKRTRICGPCLDASGPSSRLWSDAPDDVFRRAVEFL